MVELPLPQSLGDIVRYQARALPNHIAYRFEGRDTTLADFDRHTNQVANGILSAGVTTGSHVCYLGRNSDLYFELLFGAAKAGAITTPINCRFAAPEIAYILEDCKAEMLVIGAEFVPLIESLRAKLKLTLKVVEAKSPEYSDFETWRDMQSVSDPGLNIPNEDAVLQVYTSGTTGHPKGAMLTHAGILGLRQVFGHEFPDWYQWTSSDSALIAVPVFHVGGTILGITTLLHGARGVIAREFDPNQILDFIEQEAITKLLIVPAAMQIVLKHPRVREIDYSHLKYMIYGASPIPIELLRECLKVFGCGFIQTYGMTETSGAIVALGPEDHNINGGSRMSSAGKPLPGVEVAIIDQSGNRLSPGRSGEILVRSISNMVGYWNLPEATAEAIDGSGWLHTGDAGYQDEDGYLYIRDRIKDVINSGGENIYPAEVENAVFCHSGVADVAVIGVPDPIWGEVPKAFVVRKDGCGVTASDIINCAREHIASFKVPKSIEFVDAVPRNSNGKILRRQLREPYWAGHSRRVN